MNPGRIAYNIGLALLVLGMIVALAGWFFPIVSCANNVPVNERLCVADRLPPIFVGALFFLVGVGIFAATLRPRTRIEARN
jgi:hypothetical protein